MSVPDELAALISTRLGGGGGGLLVMRHSVREAIRTADVAAALAAPLTDEGRALARRLGGLLPAATRVRLFWSPVPRCQETAEMIAVGARGTGGTAGPVELVGPRDYLGALYVLDPDALTRRFANLGQDRFLAAWLDAELPESELLPAPEAGRRLLRALLAERADEARALDIHVTHDLTLLTLLTQVRDVRAEGFPWPGYLEGALLQIDNEELRWDYGGWQARTSLPI